MPRPVKVRGAEGYAIETATLQRISRKVALDGVIDDARKAEIVMALNRAIALFNEEVVERLRQGSPPTVMPQRKASAGR
jgi:hypothetical protein